MRKIIPSAIVLVLLLQPAISQTSEWIRFTPKGGNFVVMLPSQPKEDVSVKENFTTHLYTVSAGKAIFLIGFGEYAPGVRIDPQKELEANRDNFNLGLKATLLTSKTYDMDGRPALEFTSETQQVNLRSRVFLVGNRVIQLATLVYKGYDESQNVDKFLDSFAFISQN
ncbi:MAG: hypothetical protein C5B55_11975 [Blastocatellia bacterium]|nr:MAG: hypothetical protein C5B55_11975 [Blastocatellia bacterium]